MTDVVLAVARGGGQQAHWQGRVQAGGPARRPRAGGTGATKLEGEGKGQIHWDFRSNCWAQPRRLSDSENARHDARKCGAFGTGERIAGAHARPTPTTRHISQRTSATMRHLVALALIGAASAQSSCDMVTLSAHVGTVDTVCCPDGAACDASGVPTSCSAECAGPYLTFVQQCEGVISAMPSAGALMALAEQCRAMGGVAECNCANKVRTS